MKSRSKESRSFNKQLKNINKQMTFSKQHAIQRHIANELKSAAKAKDIEQSASPDIS